MGSPLSPIVADITMQDLESRAIEMLPFTPSFYFRYVDDIVLAAPLSSLSLTLNIFNSLHPRLQFTMEEGVDNRLNFLDVTILINNGYIEFDWYHKPTFSGRYLNFASQHPLCHKKGVMIGLIDRAVLLSHPRFQQKNLGFVIDILLDNGYPLPLIFQVLHRRMKFLTTDNNNNNNTQITDNDKKTTYFNIPYVPFFSEQFGRLVHDLGVVASYTSFNKLNVFIKVHKDCLAMQLKNNVVYKINCKDCNASYVGQTKRLLKTRIGEHRSHINRRTAQQSVITDHRLSNHEFDWDNVEVLDEEPILFKRLISEMLFIKRQTNGLNLHNDTEGLQESYVLIVENLHKV